MPPGIRHCLAVVGNAFARRSTVVASGHRLGAHFYERARFIRSKDSSLLRTPRNKSESDDGSADILCGNTFSFFLRNAMKASVSSNFFVSTLGLRARNAMRHSGVST